MIGRGYARGGRRGRGRGRSWEPPPHPGGKRTCPNPMTYNSFQQPHPWPNNFPVPETLGYPFPPRRAGPPIPPPPCKRAKREEPAVPHGETTKLRTVLKELAGEYPDGIPLPTVKQRYFERFKERLDYSTSGCHNLVQYLERCFGDEVENYLKGNQVYLALKGSREESNCPVNKDNAVLLKIPRDQMLEDFRSFLVDELKEVKDATAGVPGDTLLKSFRDKYLYELDVKHIIGMDSFSLFLKSQMSAYVFVKQSPQHKVLVIPRRTQTPKGGSNCAQDKEEFDTPGIDRTRQEVAGGSGAAENGVSNIGTVSECDGQEKDKSIQSIERVVRRKLLELKYHRWKAVRNRCLSSGQAMPGLGEVFPKAKVTQDAVDDGKEAESEASFSIGHNNKESATQISDEVRSEDDLAAELGNVDSTTAGLLSNLPDVRIVLDDVVDSSTGQNGRQGVRDRLKEVGKANLRIVENREGKECLEEEDLLLQGDIEKLLDVRKFLADVLIPFTAYKSNSRPLWTDRLQSRLSAKFGSDTPSLFGFNSWTSVLQSSLLEDMLIISDRKVEVVWDPLLDCRQLLSSCMIPLVQKLPFTKSGHMRQTRPPEWRREDCLEVGVLEERFQGLFGYSLDVRSFGLGSIHQGESGVFKDICCVAGDKDWKCIYPSPMFCVRVLVKDELAKVKGKNGIPVNDLVKRFEERFGFILNYRLLGYDKLQSLLVDLEDICQLKLSTRAGTSAYQIFPPHRESLPPVMQKYKTLFEKTPFRGVCKNPIDEPVKPILQVSPPKRKHVPIVYKQQASSDGRKPIGPTRKVQKTVVVDLEKQVVVPSQAAPINIPGAEENDPGVKGKYQLPAKSWSYFEKLDMGLCALKRRLRTYWTVPPPPPVPPPRPPPNRPSPRPPSMPGASGNHAGKQGSVMHFNDFNGPRTVNVDLNGESRGNRGEANGMRRGGMGRGRGGRLLGRGGLMQQRAPGGYRDGWVRRMGGV